MKQISGFTAFLILLFGFTHNIIAQDTLYWLGAVSTEWSDADNWSDSPSGAALTILPGATTTAIIPSGTDYDCILDVNVTISSLELESGANFDVGSYNLELTGDLKQFGGVFLGRSASIIVGGYLLIVDGTFNSTSATLEIGSGIYEQNYGSFNCSTGILRTSDNTEIDIISFLYDLQVPLGSEVTLNNHLPILNSIEVDGVINTNLMALYLDNTDDAAVTGIGGVYTEVDEEFGLFIWRIGEEIGTYRVPLLATLEGPVIPFSASVTSAGTGEDGRILVTNMALPEGKPQVLFDGLSYSNAYGADNSTYNLNRLWALIITQYTVSPVLTVKISYTADDLTGTAVTESLLSGQANIEGPWQAASGIADVVNRIVTIEGVEGDADLAQFWTLVDNTSPNYNVNALYWTGADDNDWNNGLNWSWEPCGPPADTIPDSTMTVVFDACAIAECQASGNISINHMAFADDFVGLVDLSAATMQVNGNLVQYNGILQLGEGIIEIDGNIELLGGKLSSSEGTIQIGGSFKESTEVLDPGTANIILYGQDVSLQITSTLHSLELNSGATVTLLQDLYIDDHLIFTDGQLFLNYSDLYLLDGSNSAISRTSGGVVSETYDFTSLVHWSINENTGEYVVPFLSENGTYLPIKMEIQFAGKANNGLISFGTYSTDPTFYPNNSPAPPGSNNNNSEETIDRYWLATCSNYEQHPEYDLRLRYSTTDLGGTNNVDDQNLQLNYFDGEDWVEHTSTFDDGDLEFTIEGLDFFSFWCASSEDLSSSVKGSSCDAPALLSETSSSNVYSLEGQEFWFKYLTSGMELDFSICQMNSLAGIEIERLVLYSGSCGTLSQVEELVVVDPDNIVFSKTGLSDNTWYLIKLERAENE